MRGVAAGICIAVVSVVAAYGADSSIGTWQLDVAKSKVNPPPVPYKTLTLVEEEAQGGATLSLTGELPDGSPVRASMTFLYDGKPVHFTGGGLPYDTIAARRLDSKTVIYERSKTGGLYNQKVSTVISKDGKTRTQKSSGMGADGKRHESLLIFHREPR